MVEIKTAIQELNNGAIHFEGDDFCTTPGEVVVLLKRLEEYEALGREPDELQPLVAKDTPMEPYKDSLADRGCPRCGAYINWDALNDPISYAPDFCKACGQKFDWAQEIVDQ